MYVDIERYLLAMTPMDPYKRNMYLSREIPFLGKNKNWKDYNLGRGEIDLNEALKQSIPFIK